MSIFLICSARVAAPNLKDRSQNLCAFAHGVLVGNLPKRDNFPSPCNGLLALEGSSFSTGSLRDLAFGEYPAERLDGLTSPA
jgi:hypothetical protein